MAIADDDNSFKSMTEDLDRLKELDLSAVQKNAPGRIFHWLRLRCSNH